MANLNDFLWLTTRKGLFKSFELRALMDYFGSPERIFLADSAEFERLNLTEAQKAALRDKNLRQVEQIQADCDRLNMRIMTFQDADYPARLKEIDDPPYVLYLKGRPLHVDDVITVGVVGTRSCTPYGIQLAGRLGLDLARAGVTLVSGIAKGIDAAGIRGALQGGGTVISVLGGGIDVPYPKEHTLLYDDVAASGTLVSEYPPGTSNAGYHFPVRNRIISGLSLGVAVVEASVPSGALITARQALDQSREAFAFPGPVNASASLGCNRLIQRGEAKLIMSAADILEEFASFVPNGVKRAAPMDDAEAAERLAAVPVLAQTAYGQGVKKPLPTEKEVDKEPPRAYISLADGTETFNDDERNVMLALAENTLTADELTEILQIPTPRISSTLTMLQVRDLVEERPGKRFYAKAILKP